MGKATFGEVIRERRRHRDLTQRDVADRIGASTPYIGHLESGKRHPSEEIVARLADALGFDRRELFFLANPKAHAIVAASAETSVPSAWEEFRRNAQLQNSMRVTAQEMEMLARVALMGQVRSTRDFLYILNTVRHALTT
ncbi:MAG TPA: helix-turn-helix transcriptional regulator [Candidatus Binataceae bacterium]|nr:helix-turn-helix transcriptional regulator [Candidatus Binataceae bacterium]HVA82219.1 helix-turn-helix transcriptional regulator [Candidatus Binataceae bacterium]